MAEHPLFENFRKGMAIRNPFVDRLAIGQWSDRASREPS